MGSPNKLKNLNAFVNGLGYLGKIAEFDPPKLAIATEDWRGGGAIGPVKIDKGLEGLEAKLKFGSHEVNLFRLFGSPDVAGVRLRLVEAFQADNGAPAQAVEHYIGGRFTEIDPGSSKPGGDTEHEFTAAIAYYRKEVNGRAEVEIDQVAGIFIVDGVDRYAEVMAIITS